jgi:hypothetical protein
LKDRDPPTGLRHANLLQWLAHSPLIATMYIDYVSDDYNRLMYSCSALAVNGHSFCQLRTNTRDYTVALAKNPVGTIFGIKELTLRGC